MKKLLIICLMLVCALVLTACGQEKQEQAACESHVIQEMKDDHADGKGRHEADTIRDETDEYGKRRSLLLCTG